MALLGQLDTPSATTLAFMPCLSVDAPADPFIGDCENQLMESEFLCLMGRPLLGVCLHSAPLVPLVQQSYTESRSTAVVKLFYLDSHST